MTTSAIYDVIDKLVDLFTAVTVVPGALAGVLVLDGIGVTDDPGDFLMIGADDPDAEDNSSAGTSEQEWAHVGNVSRDETGTVTCSALSWNGNGDVRAARAGVRVITGAVEAVLRGDPTIGLHEQYGPFWVEFGGASDYLQVQGDGGAAAQTNFSIRFRARLRSV